MNEQTTAQAINAIYGRLSLQENGIIYWYLPDGVSVDISEAQQLVQDVRTLDNSGSARLLIVQGTNNDFSFSAQKYLGTVDGVSHLALVVNNRFQAKIAQLFMSMMRWLRSPYEMRFFYQLSNAETWLKYVNE